MAGAGGVRFSGVGDAGLMQVTPGQRTRLTMRPAGLLSLLAVVAAMPGQAAAPCAGADTRLTPARAQHFAPAVAKAAGGVAPSSVELTGFAQQGDWIFVHAEFTELEPAFFFFRIEGDKMRFVDLWAGFTVEEEKDEDVAWARSIGLPADFAACFARTAIDN